VIVICLLTVSLCSYHRCSGMPEAVGFKEVAERFKKFNIHGLLIVGGFEVSFIFLSSVSDEWTQLLCCV